MAKLDEPLCIIGAGCSTAIGANLPATAAAVRAGISGFQEHPYMINQEGEPYILAYSPFIDSSYFGIKRFIELAVPPIREALSPLEKLTQKPLKIDVTIGLPEIRPGIEPKLSGRLSDSIKSIELDGVQINQVRTAFKGHAAGLMALESSARQLRSGDCEFCLVGGVDTYIDPDTLDWVEDNEQMHTPNNAWGFVPGEAGAFCLVCLEKTAIRYGLPVKAKVLSVASAMESNRIKTKTVCIGKGLTVAVSKAFDGLPEEFQVDQTYCDQNGEAYRTDEFGFMLARLNEKFVNSAEYEAPADCWGDVGAASGVLFLGITCVAVEKGYAVGANSLLWVSSEAGDRSAAVLCAG